MAAEPATAWGRVQERFARVEANDALARRAMWLMWPLGVLILVWFGRQQWFLIDDWAFLFTRQRIREAAGVDDMLLVPQDGHWMTWPLLVFWALRSLFGTGSYLPYLVVLWTTHLGVVALARVLMGRLGVAPWTRTLMSALLLLFGAGWENLLFAVQIVYNLSLIAFLAQLLLVDHDGPIDRRDWAGAGVSLIGVSSSGFGPFFALGVGVLLAMRCRWAALAVAVGPQAAALGWWWLTWGDDPAGDAGHAGPRFVVRFVESGVAATGRGLTGVGILGGAAFVLAVAMAVWPRIDAGRRAALVALVVTVLAMFAGIGLRREAFGIGMASSPRYLYVAAVLLAAPFALGLDQARRFAPWARWVPVAVLVFATTRNVAWLDNGSDYWSSLADADRRTFSLVAGSELRETVPGDRPISAISLDVRVSDLDVLVADGAITPTVPVTPQDRALVAAALGVDQVNATP